MQVGLNLYSIRTMIKEEKDYIETLLKLREMGYAFVQFSGASYNPQFIKKGVEESGLPVVLTHAPIDLIFSEPEKLTEEHLAFGCKNIGIGIVPLSSTKSDKEWRDKIDELNKCAQRIKKAGGNFFYHNHHQEFHLMDNGQTAFDYMITNAPDINFTLDTYWVQYAGYNPETMVKKLIGRVGCVHLKDYSVFRTNNEKQEFFPRFAPVGKGSLDMPAIIEACKVAGTQYFIVEQDDAVSYDDPLAQVKMSVDYLKTL